MAVAQTLPDRFGAPAVRTGDADFNDPDLFGWLECASTEGLDSLPFGVIAMAPDGMVTAYNRAEANNAGLTPRRVIGRHFFTQVGPCANNAQVGFRFVQEPVLDTMIDYVFPFRMAPRRVRLRLLKQTGGRQMYLVVLNLGPDGQR